MGATGSLRHRARQLSLLLAACASLILIAPNSAMAAITFSSPVRVTSTPATYEDLAPDAWSPDGTRLLFAGEDGGGVSQFIGTVDRSGANYNIMRDWPSADEPLAWSPDGGLFSFATGWNGNQIMYMGSDPFSGPLETVVRTQGDSWGWLNMGGGQWTPDGRSIVYGDYFAGWWNIMAVPVSGGIPRQLGVSQSPPRLSPDGRLVAFIGTDFRAMVMGTGDGPPESVIIELTPPGWMSETTPPRWSADGSAMAWVDRNPADPMGPFGAKRVWLSNADGSDRVLLGEFSEVKNGLSDMQSVSVSRDGSYVAFTARNIATAQRNLFVMSADGGAPVYLGDVEAMFTTPQWSPTSDTLAFTSNDGEVWTVDVSGLPDQAPGPRATLAVAEPNATGWYPGSACPTFIISAPAGHTAWYRWNDEIWMPAIGEMTALNGGINTLTYCLDEPDNLETLRSKVFRVDGQPPMFDPQWRNRVTADRHSLTITDVNIQNAGGSGFGRVELLANGNVVASSTDPNATLVWNGLETGVVYDLELAAYDGSGYRASEMMPFSIRSAPVAAAEVTPEPSISGWYPFMPFVQLRYDDQNPGGPLYYRWDGAGEWIDYQGIVPPPATDGVHTLEFYQEDIYGEHAIQSLELRIDSVPPTVPTLAASATSTSEIRIDVSGAIDDASGLNFIELWDGDALIMGLAPGVETVFHSGLLEDSEHSYRVRAMDAAGNVSEFSSPVVARTLSTVPPQVPAGSSVHVDLDEVVLDFDTVLSPGDVEIRTVATQRDPLPNFRTVPGLYYDIHPTATFQGNVSVTLRIPEDVAVDFQSIRLLHWDGGAWQDITTSVDSAARTITGRTDSFSEFSVQEAEATATVTSTPATAPWALMLAVAAASGWTVMRRRAAA